MKNRLRIDSFAFSESCKETNGIFNILAISFSYKFLMIHIAKLTGFRFWILPLLLCFTTAGTSQPILDSIQIWKQTQNLQAICTAARGLDKTNSTLPACVKMKVLLAASRASIDLYQPKDCLDFARAASSIPFNQCRDSALIMEAFLQEAIALNMLEQPEKDKSVSLTEQVIRFGEDNEYPDLVIRAYTHLGMMLNKSGAYQKAKEMFLKGNRFLESSQDMRRKATSFANIALCDLNLKQYKSGLVSIDSAIYFVEKIDLPQLRAHCYGLKSGLHDGLGDEAGWAAAVNTAIQISKSIGNLNQAAMGLADVLNHYVNEGQFNKAIPPGTEALQILENNNQYPLVSKNVYKGLYKAYQGIGNNPLAIQYLEKYVNLKDSLENEAFKKQVYELNLKYEVQEKDNKLLQQKLALKNSRMLIFGALSSTALLSILFFFIYWRNNYQRQIIAAQFHRERELEKENSRLRKLYPFQIGQESEPSPAQIEENLLKQLFLHSCRLMETEQLYLNPELDLSELVKRLNTNRSYLSQAINQYSDDGFRSFLNKYRVQHAKNTLWAIAIGDSNIPLSEVWQYSGMNSSQSFYRIFKSVTGLTPKEYHDQVKLELSRRDSKNEEA